MVLAELDTEIKIRNPVRCFYGNPYYPQAGWYCAGCGERKEPVLKCYNKVVTGVANKI